MPSEEGVPMYLRQGWGDERCRRIARFRLGNKMGQEKYWEAEEGRRCRVSRCECFYENGKN